VLYEKGEYEAAEAQMEKSIRLLKQPDKTYFQHYADILMKVNKPEKAEEYRTKAAEL
jgi:predicted Zn-dependent protease